MSDKRAEVRRLLEEAARRKLLRSETKFVEQLLRSALNLAVDLHDPWPALASYRLALVLLRDPGVDLREVDKLLERASTCEVLGSNPLLYRLAVLHRVQASSKLIDEVFAVARDRVSGDSGDSATLQSSTFNMLELAACFLANSLGDLEGLGDLSDEVMEWAFPPGLRAWVLVSNVPGIEAVRYRRELAVCELEAIGRQEPDAILFQEPATSNTGDGVSYRRGGHARWDRTTSDLAWKLVRLVLKSPGRRAGRRDLTVQLHGASTGPENLRQSLSRAKKQFRSEVGYDVLAADNNEIWIDDRVRLYGVTPVSRR